MSGLYSIKPWFVRGLGGFEDRLVARGVSADALSYAAVIVSLVAGCTVIAGYRVHPWLWFLVAPLAVARLALNALDGAVARRTRTARPFGKVINEICDRVSDVCFVAPLVVFLSPVLVVAALVVISIVSLCGSLGEVVGGSRLTSGPMGKADRVAVVGVAAAGAGLTGAAVPVFSSALLIITAGGLATIAVRLRALRALAEETAHVR